MHDRGTVVRREGRHVEAVADADLVADECATGGATHAFIDQAVAVVVGSVADLDRADSGASKICTVAVLIDPVAAGLRCIRMTRGVAVVAVVAERVPNRGVETRGSTGYSHGHDRVAVAVVIVVTSLVDGTVEVVVTTVADFRRGDVRAHEVCAVAVLVDTVTAGLRCIRMTRGVGVVTVVADRGTARRVGTSDGTGCAHLHGRVAVIITVVITAFIDEVVAVVVDVVADLRSRRSTDRATVVDDAVAIVVDCIGTDFRNRPIGNRAAERVDRRTDGAGRETVPDTSSDTGLAVPSASRAGRRRRDGAVSTRAKLTLVTTTIFRTDHVTRTEIASGELTRLIRDGRTGRAGAARRVREDSVGTAGREHRNENENERTAKLVHHCTFSPF